MRPLFLLLTYSFENLETTLEKCCLRTKKTDTLSKLTVSFSKYV